MRIKRFFALMKCSPLNNERGGPAVEMAIVLPLLLVIVFGIIEFSVGFYNKAVITNASREGARLGIVYRYDVAAAANKYYIKSGTPGIKNTVDQYAQNHLITFGPSNLPQTTVLPTDNGCNDQKSGNPITVQVTYQYGYLLIPSLIKSITGPITLTGQTIMRCE